MPMDNITSNNNSNFFWWFGVVEDRNDPLRLGRCRVRIIGYHTEDEEILPSDDLPWALPVMPANSAGTSGVGWSPTGAVEGSWVVGFFADGENGQHPMFFGTVGSIPGGLAADDCAAGEGSGSANDDATSSGPKGEFVEPSGNAKDYESYLEQYLDANGPKNLPNYSKMAKAAIMAQCAHESGGFRYFKEFASGKAYEGRKDLGNTQSGDGVKYKGRGYIQITGRANYRACGNYIGKDLINQPQLLEQKEAGAAAVIWFFSKGNPRAYKIGTKVPWSDLLTVTKSVNGGTNGLPDRTKKFEYYRKKYGV